MRGIREECGEDIRFVVMAKDPIQQINAQRALNRGYTHAPAAQLPACEKTRRTNTAAKNFSEVLVAELENAPRGFRGGEGEAAEVGEQAPLHANGNGTAIGSSICADGSSYCVKPYHAIPEVNYRTIMMGSGWGEKQGRLAHCKYHCKCQTKRLVNRFAKQQVCKSEDRCTRFTFDPASNLCELYTNVSSAAEGFPPGGCAQEYVEPNLHVQQLQLLLQHFPVRKSQLANQNSAKPLDLRCALLGVPTKTCLESSCIKQSTPHFVYD